MAEEYSGVKFRTVIRKREAPSDSRLEELKRWCNTFHQSGLAPEYPGGSYGNLSFRVEAGKPAFIITGTCMGLKEALCDEQFVIVEFCEPVTGTLYAQGTRLPSSESFMHYALYHARPDVMAVFHGHSPELMEHAEKLGIPVSAEAHPYGTQELAAAMAELAARADLFIARNHGFIALGASMEEAGTRALDGLKRCAAPDEV